MKIAIFGLSATGKTEVSKELALILGFKHRHCGEIIKEKTKFLGLQSLSLLPLEKHKEIDNETKLIASTEENIIIEGRYLNYVLDGYDQFVFIELICTLEVRSFRLNNKQAIIDRDREHDKLKQELYKTSQPRLKHSIVIDTSEISVKQCAQKITNYITSNP